MIAHLTERERGSLHVWDHPRDRVEYIIGVDTAEGIVRDRAAFKGAHLTKRDARPDHSAAIVIEAESSLHVASLWGDFPTTAWTPMVAALGYYYNDALLVPEVNGPGIEVVNSLVQRLEYPNVYRRRVVNIITDDPLQVQWGWLTGHSSRKLLIARIEERLNNHQLFTRDKDLISELQTLEIDEGGIERAKYPNKDDRVMALGMALRARWEIRAGDDWVTEDQPDRKKNDGLDKFSRLAHAQRREELERKRIEKEARDGGYGLGAGSWDVSVLGADRADRGPSLG